jgi:hypothetical protein
MKARTLYNKIINIISDPETSAHKKVELITELILLIEKLD